MVTEGVGGRSLKWLGSLKGLGSPKGLGEVMH